MCGPYNQAKTRAALALASQQANSKQAEVTIMGAEKNLQSLEVPAKGTKWTFPGATVLNGSAVRNRVLEVWDYGVSYDLHRLVLMRDAVNKENKEIYSVGIATFNRDARRYNIKATYSVRELISMKPCAEGLLLLCYAAGIFNNGKLKEMQDRINFGNEADVCLDTMRAMLASPCPELDKQWNIRDLWYVCRPVGALIDHLHWIIRSTTLAALFPEELSSISLKEILGRLRQAAEEYQP